MKRASRSAAPRGSTHCRATSMDTTSVSLLERLRQPDEKKAWEEIMAEQEVRKEAYLAEQRKRKAAGLPPPPNWNGEWKFGL